MVLPWGISIRVEICGTGRKQKCGLLWRLYIQSFYMYWSPLPFHGDFKIPSLMRLPKFVFGQKNLHEGSAFSGSRGRKRHVGFTGSGEGKDSGRGFLFATLRIFTDPL